MSVKRIKNLVKQLNEYRHAYYNQDAPLVSDAEYDRLFDELKELEEQTGFILSNSPTQTVGYYPVSELAKVTHPIPLLSLEKTKLISELLDFMKGQEVLFMLKLDGLTTKLIYEDGRLIQASTRGDGEVGEDITHNIPAFLNVPLTIPHKERLVITGESFIPTNDFERLKDTLRDGNGKPYKNGRNFASGSVRSLDPKNCIGRCVRFLPFNVLEGMEDVPFPDSRACKLEGLTHLGFGYCPFFSISGTGLSKEYAEKFIQELVSTAANLHLPIHGNHTFFQRITIIHIRSATSHQKIIRSKSANINPYDFRNLTDFHHPRHHGCIILRKRHYILYTEVIDFIVEAQFLHLPVPFEIAFISLTKLCKMLRRKPNRKFHLNDILRLDLAFLLQLHCNGK